jgi:TRAP-type uncharacterized transport system substrate-binding protein
MLFKLRQALLMGLVALLASASWSSESPETSASQGLVISSGSEGGGYWSAAQRLQAVAKGLGSDVENRTSTGSLDNLEQLTSTESPVNLAFAQADAVQYFLFDNPGAGENFDVLENIGQECVFIVTAADGGVRTDADLQKAANYRLGISSNTSGVAVTFNYMLRQVPELKALEVVYGDTGAALAQLQTPEAGVDAVMVVHRPREHSPTVDLALSDPERYRFLEIHDERLTNTTANGQEIYRKMDLAMPGPEDGSRQTVNTICVKGLLLANRSKLSEGQLNLLSDIVNTHWMQVFATE